MAKVKHNGYSLEERLRDVLQIKVWDLVDRMVESSYRDGYIDGVAEVKQSLDDLKAKYKREGKL